MECICKFAKFEKNQNNEPKLLHYTCDDVRDLNQKWKQDFRIENKTDEVIKSVGKDRYYDEFCKKIDEFLQSCPCVERRNRRPKFWEGPQVNDI